MDWKTVRLIWILELRTLLRSRRTIILSVVLPILVMPLMLMATRFSADFQERQEASTVYRDAIGGDWVSQTRGLIESGGDQALNDPDSDLGTFNYEETSAADPAEDVRSGELDFYLETFSPARADLEWNQDEEEDVPSPRSSNRLRQRIDGVPVVRIVLPGNRATAAAGAGRMADLLVYARRIEAERALRSEGFELELRNLLSLEDANVASQAQTSGLLVGRFLTLLLFILTLTGGSVVAMDIIAGEKERGTLETLLTTEAGRSEIVAAKQLVILTTALVIALLQIANLLVYTGLDILPLPEAFSFQPGFSAGIAIVLLYVPFATLIAGVLLLLSAYAKSYKEAQLYFFPVYLIGMMPAAAGAVGDIPLRSAIVLIPVANVSIGIRDLLSGHPDWWMLLVVFAVNSLAAVWVLDYSTALLGDERLVTAKQEYHPEGMAGLAAFRLHLWRWYGVLWAVLFVGAASIPALSDLRIQALFNEIIVLGGGTLLILRVYRLNAKRALALRPVPFSLWPILLLLVGPLHLAAALVNRFANTIFPVPRSYLEQLGEQFSFEGVPGWQLLVLFAVLPGIFEEIEFRGPLLYGLRRKFSLPVLALVVGLVFGFFHFSLFRIVTTGVIGIVITAVALMPGSIFPGMLLHFGNNALALLLAQYEIPIDQLPIPMYAFAVGSTLALVWVVYRNRTLYPEE